QLIVAFAGARPAQDPAVLDDFALETDALSTLCARYPRRLITRHVLGAEPHPNPLDVEQLFVRHLAIGAHLLRVLVLNLGIHVARGQLGALLSCHSNGAILPQIAKRSRHLAEVAKLQRPLTQPAAGDDGDGVGGAAVDLDEGHQALAILAGRVVDAEQLYSV